MAKASKRTLADIVTQIGDKIDKLSLSLHKKEPKYFLKSQIIGTVLLLGSWIIQNTYINYITSKSNAFHNIQTDMISLSNRNSQELLTINLFRSVLNARDTSLGEHMRAMEAYANYCKTLTSQLRIVAYAAPLYEKISANSEEIVTEEWKDSIMQRCDETDNITNKYYYTATIGSMDRWQISVQAAYRLTIDALMTAAQERMIKLFQDQKFYNQLFRIGYIGGSIFILFSLLKGFKKVTLKVSKGK